jgi:hypothetical protein
VTPREKFLLFVGTYAGAVCSKTIASVAIAWARQVQPNIFETHPNAEESLAFEFVSWQAGDRQRPAWFPMSDGERAVLGAPPR